MGIRVRAHFDGKVIVPDDRVDLPANTRLTADLEVLTDQETERLRADALRAWEEFKANPIAGLSISDESLRRENLYEERL